MESERRDFVEAVQAAAGPHAPAALRQTADARKAVADRDSRRAFGEASQAVVAL
jgi:hypothetical protein